MSVNWYPVPWIERLFVSEPFELFSEFRPDGSAMPSGYGMMLQVRLFRFDGTSRSWDHERAIERASAHRPWSPGMEGLVGNVRSRGPFGLGGEELDILCMASVQGEGDSRHIAVFEKPRPGKRQPRRRYYLTDWGPHHASLAVRPLLCAPLRT
jgi:hypothetical protein